MKKLLLALTIAASVPAQAADINCKTVGDLAQVIMEKRQEGVPVSELMEVANGNSLSISMIIDAYKKTQYTSSTYQAREALEFRNSYELACYEYNAGKGE